MIARIISGILIYTLAVTQVVAQTATLLPNAKQTFLGTTGAPLAAGTVTLYVPNSTTKKTTWVDPNQTSANTNPVVLDAAGRAIIFGQGNYRQVVKDKNGVTIWDAFTSAVGSASPSGSTGTDTAPVGTVIPYSGFAVPTNWALAYGQQLNRVTYAQLLAAITISSTAVSCTASSTTLTGFASTAQFSVGEPIEATCLAANITISSITNSTTIVVSAAAVSSGAVTAVVFPWGNGDGNSTFNVPDLRGRAFAGADAMGGTAAGRLSPTYYGASAAAPAIAGGLQSETLLAANLPPYTPTGLVSTPTINLTNNHGVPTTDQSGSVPYGGGSNAGTGNITATATTPTFMGIAQGGISTPLSNIQPTLTVNYIIKVAPNTSGAGGVVSIGGMFGDIICDATFLCANQTIGLATQLTGTILANIGASSMTPTAVTFTQWMDDVCGSAQGEIIYRSVSTWKCLSPGTNGQILKTQGAASDVAWTTVGTGTVTSVAMSVPSSLLSVSGSPITSSGTLALTLTTQSPNLLFAGPSSGGSATPTFRTIVSADIPSSLSISSPIISGGTITGLTGLAIRDTSAAFDVTIAATSSAALSAGRILTINMGNIAHTLALGTTANTITFPTHASYTLISNGDTATVTNAMLANSSLTINSQTMSLGGTYTIAATAASMTVGTTTILSGSTTNILYNNSGVLGEYTTTGTGTVVALSGAPSLSGTTTISSLVISAAMVMGASSIAVNNLGNGDLIGYNGYRIGWNSGATVGLSTTAIDTNISRVSAGLLQVGTTASNALGSMNLASLTASAGVTAGSANTITASTGTGGVVAMSANPSFTGTVNIVGITTGGVALFGAGGIVIDNTNSNLLGYNGYKVAWNSGATVNSATTAFDTNFSRVSAGLLQLGTTASNALGSLNLASLTAGTGVTIGAGSAITSSGPGGALASGAFAAAYSLPTASTTVLGGVKVDGTTITISAGVISSSGGAASLVIGTSAITGGVVGKFLFENPGGTLSEIGLTSAHLFVGNGSNIPTDVALSGDATMANTGAITVTKTNGSSFGTAALVNTGTSGATIPLLNGANGWTGNNTFLTATFGSSSVVINSSGGDYIAWNGSRLAWTSVGSVSTSTTAFDTNFSRASAGVLQLGTTASNALGSLNLTNITATGATIILSGLSTDAAATDTTLCSKSSDGTVLKGSGTLGICLGTSSARYKTNIREIDVGLDEIMNLPAKSFYLDAAHGDPKKQMYGFTAEDCAKVLPKLTGMDAESRPNTCDYLGVVPVLVRATQQLKADNDNLRAEVEELKRNESGIYFLAPTRKADNIVTKPLYNCTEGFAASRKIRHPKICAVK